MPGVGDFNLRSFFRALGIKNPQPSVREFIQPVILAGDMCDIVPQYRAPSGVFGGDTPATASQNSVIQVTSRSEGGTLIHQWASDSNLINMRTGTALVLDTITDSPHPLGCQLSVEPPVSLVETGAVLVNPFVASDSPNPSGAHFFPKSGSNSRPMWIRPGDSMIWLNGAAATAITDWILWITDIPASENSIL